MHALRSCFFLHGGRGPHLLHVSVHNGPASAKQPVREAELVGGHLVITAFESQAAACLMHNIANAVVFCAGHDGGWKANRGAPGGTGPGGCICPAHDPPGRVGHH